MKLYKITEDRLNRIHTNQFQLEKEIQNLIEKNLGELFDLEFVKSELRVPGYRFDTLCFDYNSNSFVIIEYKCGSSYSVIDQGYTYLSILLNNKSDFILEYNEQMGKNLKRDEVDWSQSRVIFISPNFSNFQKTSINFKNVPFELWEIVRYSNETVGLSKIETDSEVDISSTIIGEKSSNVVSQVSKEIVKIDEDFHLKKNQNRPQWVIELYQELKKRILELGDNIEIKYGKQTIGFKDYKIFTDLILYNGGVGVLINLKKGELNDNMNLTEDLSEKGHWGNGDYRVWMNSNEHIDYVMNLIKQSYQKQGK